MCKLLKSLYGLKQDSWQWFAKLSTNILGLGFKQFKSDYSMFTLSQASLYVVLLIYVNGILFTGNNVNFINHLKHLLDAKFKLKYLGFVKYFHSIKVARSS